MPVVATTFNPADKTASVTLSANNLTATFTAAGNALVRSVVSHSSGLYYVEYKISVGGGASTGCGLAMAAANTINADDTNQLTAYYIGSGNIWTNGVNNGNLGGAAAGDVVGCAVNLTLGLIWFRRNAGAWNNNGSANPVNGATGGGVNISALSLPLFGWVSGTGAGPVWVANFGGSAYAYPAPAGFGVFGTPTAGVSEPRILVAA